MNESSIVCLCLLLLPHTRWLYAWSLPLFLLLTLSLPLPASPSHPSDEKEHSSHFPRNISAASLGSLIGHHHNANHAHQPEPSVTDPLMGGVHATRETDTHIDMEKNDVQVGPLNRIVKMMRLEWAVEFVDVHPAAEGADRGPWDASIQIETRAEAAGEDS